MLLKCFFELHLVKINLQKIERLVINMKFIPTILIKNLIFQKVNFHNNQLLYIDCAILSSILLKNYRIKTKTLIIL
jgi:hypothetical protein